MESPRLREKGSGIAMHFLVVYPMLDQFSAHSNPPTHRLGCFVSSALVKLISVYLDAQYFDHSPSRTIWVLCPLPCHHLKAGPVFPPLTCFRSVRSQTNPRHRLTPNQTKDA